MVRTIRGGKVLIKNPKMPKEKRMLIVASRLLVIKFGILDYKNNYYH